MDRQAIISQLGPVIVGYLESQCLELVDLIFRYEGGGLVLRILADKPGGGISLDECARLNREISLILDEKDILKGRYLLEVASPGLDRPLATKKDFLRCINKGIRFFLREPTGGKLELEGIIKEADDFAVYLQVKGEILKVNIENIAKAKQILDI